MNFIKAFRPQTFLSEFFFSFKILNPLFLKISLISLSKFLSTASGLIIDNVCSNITHNTPLLIYLII